MKHCFAFGLLAVLIWAAAADVPAQERGIKTDYEKLTIEYGEFEGNLEGLMHRLSKGVKMKFMKFFDKPSNDDLEVQAETVNFTYIDDKDKIPDLIVFEGKVRFSHPRGTVHADKATVNLQTEEVFLTGNSTADWPPVREWKADWFRLDLDTGLLTAGRGTVREIDLRGGDKDKDPETANTRDPE